MQICQNWKKNAWLLEGIVLHDYLGKMTPRVKLLMMLPCLKMYLLKQFLRNAVWAKWAFNIILFHRWGKQSPSD